MRQLKIIALLYFLAAAAICFARDGESCRNGSGQFERKFGNYVLHIGPAESDKASCRAVLRSDDGQEVFNASDTTIEVNPVSGYSVTNDGQRVLALEGFSGGAHCCWRYWIVSIGNTPGLIKEIRNQTPIAFERLTDGRIILKTRDGAFDYFDDIPHAAAPMPMVFLQFQGRELKDIGTDFLQVYDKDIASLRQQLTPDHLNAFRFAQAPKGSGTEADMRWSETKSRVLLIVLDYLYSDREQRAWNALDEMWPPSDRDRIAKLIVETRARGILSHLGGGAD